MCKNFFFFNISCIIFQNALKCGNNIISSTKKLDKMDSDAQIMIASSLLTAVEDITMTMMESINTAGVSRIEQPNMGKKNKKNMSLVMRKPVFGVSDQVQFKPGCTATEDGQRLDNLD